MRSPWLFISDLANRRRQRLAAQSSDPTAADGSDQLLLPAPSEDVAKNGDAESQSDHSAIPLDKALREETPLGAEASPSKLVGDSQKNGKTTSVSPGTSSATQTATVRKTKTRVARNAKPAPRHKPDVALAPASMLDKLPVEPTFHDDVRSVDDDIKRLRAELVDKLRLQNEQLKKMLERFDRQ